MLLSVLHPSKSMADEQNLTKSFWHWLVPVLISLAVTIAGVVLTTGGTIQRLTTAEKQIEKLEADTVKTKELQPQLTNIDKNIDEIKTELKEQRRK